MNKLLAIGLIILSIALAGCVNTTKNENNPVNEIIPTIPSAGKLIAGASCEQDSDCVYAINAYPTQKCISANCPPPEMEQPAPNDSAYEWKQTYLDECVNTSQLDGKNVQGDDLIIDSRAATCACEAIQLAGTSLDGQKICRKQAVETLVEDTEI